MKTNIQDKRSRSLKSRIFLTFSLLTIVRLGSFIPVPYIDTETFTNLLQKETSSTNALAQFLNTFSGGGNNSFGILSLGILPYINASIIIQLMTTAIPSLGKLQKEDGEYGRRKLTEYTRYFTFFWAIVESIGITYNLRGLFFGWNLWTASQISLTLIAGSMIVLWFSELITKDGLGNGSSLLICFNIVSGLPDQLKSVVLTLKDQSNGFTSSLFLLLIFLLSTIGCICINEAIIKIPLVSARQLLRKSTSETDSLGNSTLPLRVNQAGVMPLVFTSYAMVIFSTLGDLVKSQVSLGGLSFLNINVIVLYWSGKLLYWAIYAGLIFFFTYFYATIVLDPQDVAERFRKNSVVILGIPPGNATKIYLTKTLRRIAKINAIFLISNIVVIQVIEAFLNIDVLSLRGLGFTSQLILVNVLIDTLNKIQSFVNEDENSF